MKVQLVFNSSDAAETAYQEYFSDAECSVVIATLNRKEATIDLETFTGQTSILDIPEGLISIVL